jgi:SAM-dependent methyltransferase
LSPLAPGWPHAWKTGLEGGGFAEPKKETAIKTSVRPQPIIATIRISINRCYQLLPEFLKLTAASPGYKFFETTASLAVISPNRPLSTLGHASTEGLPSPAGLAVVRETAAARGLSVGLHQGLADALPFPDASFDYVLSWNVIHHGTLGDLGRRLGEIWRVLRSLGCCR